MTHTHTTPEFLPTDFCPRPSVEWKFLLRRAWSGQKLFPLQLTWPGDSQRELGRFARIDSQKTPHFHNLRAIHADRLKPVICNLVPQNAIRNKALQFRNPQAIRTSLRIDSRGSGKLVPTAVSRILIKDCLLPPRSRWKIIRVGAAPTLSVRQPPVSPF